MAGGEQTAAAAQQLLGKMDSVWLYFLVVLYARVCLHGEKKHSLLNIILRVAYNGLYSNLM